MKFRCLIAALLLANPLVAQETVRLGTDAAYPPYSFLNPDEGLDGFEIELALALCAHAGLTCVWIKTPWDNLTSALEAGEIDAIMSALGPNPERAEIIAFSTPYHGNGSAAWLVRAGDSLRPGARIAALKGSLQEGYAVAQGYDVLGTDTIEAAVAAVANRDADAALGMTKLMLDHAEGSDGTLEFMRARISFDGGVRIGFRPADVTLLAAFDAAIATVEGSGKLTELTHKWFPPATPD